MELTRKELFESIFPFWNDITPTDQALLLNNSLFRTYKKGENIHGGGGECTGGIIVKSGCIRTYILSEDGKEITLYRLYPGDICMLSASCVLEAITFDVHVDSEEESECYIINSGAFHHLTETNMAVENFGLNVAVNRFSDVIWVIQQILFMSFDRRLAIFLYDEMCQTHDTTIKLTQEQIARYMGSAREVVSRMLRYFANEGIVEPLRGGVKILDKEKLFRLTQS